MKIGLAQINTANGDLEGNERKIRQYLERARAEKLDLVIFPELALVGYPPRDFLTQHGFLEKSQVLMKALAKDFSDLNFVIGSVEKNYNSAFVISKGEIQRVCRKNLLPNYDVFDERRYFKPGSEVRIVNIANHKIAITVCEDIWAKQIPLYNNDPIKQLRGKQVDFVINISASPFEMDKFEKRIEAVSSSAKILNKPFVYVNLVGGNDELIFDGGSFAVNSSGELVTQAPFFEETLHTFTLSKNTAIETSPMPTEEKHAQALVLGFRDFVRKCGFTDVTFGLSGGVDSALVLLLAIEALGKDHVHPIFMPYRHTSQVSKEDVSSMIAKLQLPISLVPIGPMMESFESHLQSTLEEKLKNLTLENMQSRIRGNILMSYSAQKNAMVINTGNKSEIAVGYCTLYGDTVGGLSPIGDLYKHEVYALTKHLNKKYNVIPERIFTRPPSAELSPDQKDADSLPPYDILDAIVKNYIENHESAEELIEKGFDQDIVHSTIKLIVQSEFKRKQMPPILRVSDKAFGIGRRMPIARKQYDL
jgi:NAD+ synthase (glutamine-hydrolysing)